MQHVSASSFAPANAADRRDHALRLYAGAVAAPAGADWQSVAHALRAALPASRGKAKPVADGWADYAPNRKCTFESVAVRFADGRAFSVTAANNPGAPFNIGRAVRAAVAFYRSKVHNAVGAPCPAPFSATLNAYDSHVAVPEFARVSIASTGAEFDVAECNARTADVRAGTWSFAPDLNGPAQRESYVLAWRAQFLDSELDWRAEHEASLGLADAIEPQIREARLARQRADVAAEARGRRERAAAVARAAGEAKRARAAEVAEAVCEAWAAAMAAALPDMPEAELSGTFDAEAVPCAAPEPVEAIPAPAPVEAIPAPAPVEEIAAAEAVEAIADSDEAWEPSAATHPYVVLCNSKAAFEKLCAVILDGTFPAAGHVAKGGAWRLSGEDAAAVRRIARTVVQYAPEA